MSFGGFDQARAQQPMSEINVTPLVDVMLVLLVIFIITAPLLASAIKLNLPDAKAPAIEQKNAVITLSIKPSGELFWNDEPLARSDIDQRMKQLAAKTPDAQVRLRVDKAAQFDVVAQVLSAAQMSGLSKVGFVTEPAAKAAADKPAVPNKP
jgi:biopolymer transport protein ExbD